MKITLHHLGPIEQAEIDLRPLTVFIGRNNTGKTWATQAIGAMFGSTMYEAYASLYTTKKILDTYSLLDEVVESIIREGNAQLDWKQLVEELGEELFTNLKNFAIKNLARFIGTELVTFDQLQMDFDFVEIKPKLYNHVIRNTVNASTGLLNSRIDISTNLLNFTTEQDSSRLYFFTQTQGSILDKLPAQQIKMFVMHVVLTLMRLTFYPRVAIFPTERATFINFSSYSQRNSLVNEKQDIPESLPRKIPTSVSLFARMLGLILDANLADRQEEIKDNPRLAAYFDLANILETEILGGQISINVSKLGLQKEFIFQTNGVNLEVSASSSMIKELAPLVLYLRYLAQPGELIIIDEPEMNLHPQAQVELMEFLAMLVNAGLHVLITTHSPYIVDHLVNLIAAARYENKAEAQELLFLERSEAFISQDKVSVYLFENGTATNVLDDKGIIHWGTFGEVSNYLSDIYARLI